MSSQKFVNILESNRKKILATLKEVRSALGADESGSSRYHSVYYRGDGSDLLAWKLQSSITGLDFDGRTTTAVNTDKDKKGQEKTKGENDKSRTSGNRNQVKKGSKVILSSGTYIVVSTGSKANQRTVSLKKVRNAKKVTIPATIKIKGLRYTVISIESKAFTGKKIQTVVLEKI